MRKFFATALSVWTLFFLTGCYVHQLPEGSSDVAVTLHLEFDTALPDFRTIVYPPVKAGTESVELRYELRVYRGVPGNFERTPYYSEHISADYDGTLSRDIRLDLKAGCYLVQVWTDFVLPSRAPFYMVSSFEDIRFNGDYAGAEPMRDAFCGQIELPIETLLEAGSTYERTVQMARPMAQYRFIATDKDEFLQFWAKRYAQTHGLAVKPDVTSVKIDDFSVRVVYPQYLPSAYSFFQDNTVDSDTGISFRVPMKERADGKVDLCFDWVLQGPQQGLVVVALEFYDPEGEYIATFPNFEVPLLRSHLTTVEGRILTAGVNSGISIDPTFDGEFNVYL